MTQNRQPMVTLSELFELAKKKEPKMARLARRSGISRATLYRIRDGNADRDIKFDTYGKLARFVLEEA
jgi:DNA-binding Xre family transcriptional regulator